MYYNSRILSEHQSPSKVLSSLWKSAQQLPLYIEPDSSFHSRITPHEPTENGLIDDQHILSEVHTINDNINNHKKQESLETEKKSELMQDDHAHDERLNSDILDRLRGLESNEKCSSGRHMNRRRLVNEMNLKSDGIQKHNKKIRGLLRNITHNHTIQAILNRKVIDQENRIIQIQNTVSNTTHESRILYRTFTTSNKIKNDSLEMHAQLLNPFPFAYALEIVQNYYELMKNPRENQLEIEWNEFHFTQNTFSSIDSMGDLIQMCFQGFHNLHRAENAFIRLGNLLTLWFPHQSLFQFSTTYPNLPFITPIEYLRRLNSMLDSNKSVEMYTMCEKIQTEFQKAEQLGVSFGNTLCGASMREYVCAQTSLQLETFQYGNLHRWILLTCYYHTFQLGFATRNKALSHSSRGCFVDWSLDCVTDWIQFVSRIITGSSSTRAPLHTHSYSTIQYCMSHLIALLPHSQTRSVSKSILMHSPTPDAFYQNMSLCHALINVSTNQSEITTHFYFNLVLESLFQLISKTSSDFDSFADFTQCEVFLCEILSTTYQKNTLDHNGDNLHLLLEIINACILLTLHSVIPSNSNTNTAFARVIQSSHLVEQHFKAIKMRLHQIQTESHLHVIKHCIAQLALLKYTASTLAIPNSRCITAS